MKKARLGFVGLAVLASVAIFLWIRSAGEKLSAPGAATLTPAVGAGGDADFVLTHILLALVVILIVARLLGMLFQRLHQPPVIGEMIAGILLGPSLLGHVAPGISAQLFPTSVLPSLSVIAQLGVILYMFLVGVELDTKLLRERVETSVAVSQAGILVPFLLGSALALWIFPIIATRNVRFTQFALFMGVAMSVTAFPVLARILTDRRMQKSPLGTIALGCAAADDVAAWCLLAFVVAVVRAHAGQALITIELTAVFIAVMFAVARPAALWMARKQEKRGETSRGAVVVICAGLLLAALATTRIGIHALFGAFLMGLVIPHDSRLAADIRAKLEDSVVVVFLPAFFAFTGLRTQVGLMHGKEHWLIFGAILLAASLGKFGGSFTAGWLTGMKSREAAALGVLMNTRGLMELIVLNVGLDLGVISPALFAMLVLMAVVTTVATTPVLAVMGSLRESRSGAESS